MSDVRIESGPSQGEGIVSRPTSSELLLPKRDIITDPNFSRSPLLMNRRRAVGAVVGAGITLFRGGSIRPASAANAEAAAIAELVGEPNYTTPVASSDKDVRMEKIGMPHLNDDQLKSNPFGKNIRNIGYHKFKEGDWIGKNSLAISSANALLWMHSNSERFLKGSDGEYNYGEYLRLLQSGKLPPEPDWSNYSDRLRDGEMLSFPMYALEGDNPAEVSNLDWRMVNVNKGITFNFTTTPGLDFLTADLDRHALEGWSFRVSKGGELGIDIWTDNTQFADFSDQQLLYDYTYTNAILHAYMDAIMSLGIYDAKGDSLFGRYFSSGYKDTMPQTGTTIFKDHSNLLLGGTEEAAAASYPNRVLKVNFLE